MSDSEFWILILAPVTSVTLTLVFACLWIIPTAEGKIDGLWKNRVHADKHGGLRLRIYNRAHRKNCREPRHRNV